MVTVHFAAVLVRLTRARTTPVRATRAGMAPMLTTLVQNSRESVSRRNCFWTSLICLLTWVAVFLEVFHFLLLLGRKDEFLVALLAALQFAEFALGFRFLGFQLLDLVFPLAAGFGFHFLEAGEGRFDAGAAAEADEVIVAGELLDHALHEVQVAVDGTGDAIAENFLDLDADLVGEHVGIADEDDGAFAAGFLQLGGGAGGGGLAFLGGLGGARREGGLELACQAHGQGVVDVGGLEILQDLVAGNAGGQALDQLGFRGGVEEDGFLEAVGGFAGDGAGEGYGRGCQFRW